METIIKKLNSACFYGLFLATPLLLTKYNYELFEFNKMLFVYAITILIATLWALRMTLSKTVTIRRTILDIPLVLFLVTQVITTLFSIDPHISMWGYYGRFNGGLLSTMCYVVLYFAAVNTLTTAQVKRMLGAGLISGVLVSIYAVAQHYGIDAHLWVQDVQNRVFSTLGQPNWLAAFVSILLPISLAYSWTWGTSSKSTIHWKFIALSALFYTTLLFTKSRSGFIGFWVAYLVYLGLVCSATLRTKTPIQSLAKPILITTLLLAMLTMYFESPFPKLNALTTIRTPTTEQVSEVPADTAQAVPTLNITDSGDIRKIVWEGSIRAILANPVIGYGPETFAWAYYRHRPIEHNTTSERDFLYNKAHNEYLNYATTSGIIGIISYLVFIGFFSWWCVRLRVHKQAETHTDQLYIFALFSSWVSILITNFFGFSVVITNVYLFTLPALAILFAGTISKQMYTLPTTVWRSIPLLRIAIIIGSAYLVSGVGSYWIADYHYNLGVVNSKLNKYQTSFEHLQRATQLRPYEPNYHNELAETYAYLALESYQLDEASASATFIDAAIAESNQALSISPYSISYWKNRTRVFYALSQLDDAYYLDALESIERANELAPTDAKILYNKGLLQNSVGDNESAIATLITVMQIKPNYRDAAWALSLFYEEEENEEESTRWLQYILDNIEPNDVEVRKKLGI